MVGLARCLPVALDVILLVPLGKMPEAHFDGRRRLEAEIPRQRVHIRIGLVHVPRLHGQEFLLAGLVNDALGHQTTLQRLHEVQQVLRLVVADVVDPGRVRASLAVIRGRVVQHIDDSLYNVVDIGEIPLHITVVEDLDGFALYQLFREGKIGHIRAAIGAVNREEAQTGGGDAVEMGIGVGHQLVGFFCGGVEGDGVGHVVVRGERGFLLVAVDGGGGGVEEMPYRVVAAGLQDVEKSGDVAVDVGFGVGDGVADAGLGGQIHHNVGLVLCKQRVHHIGVRQITLDEGSGKGRKVL